MEQLKMFGAYFNDLENEKKAIQKEKGKQEKLDYWLRFNNWKAQVGNLARIDSAIAFCKDLNKKRYAMGMRVKILSIDDNDVCTVETTKEWEEACLKADSAIEGELAGTLWLVDIEDLAPILNK